MPGRPQPFVTDYIYHIYNKSIDGKRIFVDESICRIFLDVIRYYRSTESYLRYSKFKNLSEELKQNLVNKINDSKTFRISLLGFSLMPTHYHLILRQNQANAVSFFISQIQNSITKYYNVKNDRKGPIFLQTFKSKLIQSEEQLKHTTRYVHLNILSSGGVESVEEIEDYPFSSFAEYVAVQDKSLSEQDYVLDLFNKDRERYKRFVLDNAEHQKMLEFCKYTEKW